MDKEIQSFKDEGYGYTTTFGKLRGNAVFKCGYSLFVKLHDDDKYAISMFGHYKQNFAPSTIVTVITELYFVFTEEGGY